MSRDQNTALESLAAGSVQAPPRWGLTASCGSDDVDPELFFPLDENGAGADTARAVCRDCVVRGLCLTYALNMGFDVGIWGGLSTSERNALRAAGRGSHTRGRP